MTGRRGERSAGYFLYAFIGLLFIVAAICLVALDYNANKNGFKHEATIVEIATYPTSDDDYKTFISLEFQIDGETHRVRSSSYEPSMEVGQSIILYYNPDSPMGFVVGELDWKLVLLCGGAGLIFTFIGLLTAFNVIKFQKKLQHLEANGRKITATIIDVDHLFLFSTRRSPDTIYCQDADGNKYIQKFRARPSEYFLLGDLVDVYVETDCKKDYIVDVTTRRPPEKFTH